MVNSIKKGKRGELEIAHLLSEITGVVWNRVPCSGGLFTSSRQEFRGDVYTDDEFHKDIVIEVKNQKVLITLNEVISKQGSLQNWINQLNSESEGKLGVLFFKNKGKWIWYLHCPGGVLLMTKFVNCLKDHSLCFHSFGMINRK